MFSSTILFCVCSTGFLLQNCVKCDQYRSEWREFENGDHQPPYSQSYHHHRPPSTGLHGIHPSYTYHNHDGYPSALSDQVPKYKPENHLNTKEYPELEERNVGRRDGTRSPSSSNSGQRQGKHLGGDDLEVPAELLEKLETLDNDEILEKYIEGMPTTPVTLENRFIDIDEKHVKPIKANSKCSPENVTVSLGDPESRNVFYIPSCTKIERCGGCCSKNFRSCQPTKMETVHVKVIKAEYKGGLKFGFLSSHFVPVEKHLQCACGCKIKAENCQSNQKHSASHCRCECMNTDEQTKCYKDVAKKVWNDETCTCNCRTITECSTGSQYDDNECRCKIKLRKFAKGV